MPDLWGNRSNHGEGGWGSSSRGSNDWTKSTNGSWSSSSDNDLSNKSEDFKAWLRQNPNNKFVEANVQTNIERYELRRPQDTENSKRIKVIIIILLLFIFGPTIFIGVKIYQINNRDYLEDLRPELIKAQKMALEKKVQRLEEETQRQQAALQQRERVAAQRAFEAKQIAEQHRRSRANGAVFPHPDDAPAPSQTKFSGYSKNVLLASIVAQTGSVKQQVLQKRQKALQQIQANEKEGRKHTDYEKKLLLMPDYDITIKSKQWEHTDGNQDTKTEYESVFLAINEGFIQTDFSFCLSHNPDFSAKAQEYSLTLFMTPNRPGINVLDLKEIYPDGDKDIDTSIASCFSTLASALYAPKQMSKSSTLTLILSANEVKKEKNIASDSIKDEESDNNNARRLEYTSTIWFFPKSLTEQKTNEEYEFLFGEKLDTLKQVIKDCSKGHDAPEFFMLTLAIAPQGGPIYITSTNYSNAECLYQNKELNMMKNTVDLKFNTSASVSIKYALEGVLY